jgi:hypothetical protein
MTHGVSSGRIQVMQDGRCCWFHGDIAGFMVNPPAVAAIRLDFRQKRLFAMNKTMLAGMAFWLP